MEWRGEKERKRGVGVRGSRGSHVGEHVGRCLNTYTEGEAMENLADAQGEAMKSLAEAPREARGGHTQKKCIRPGCFSHDFGHTI